MSVLITECPRDAMQGMEPFIPTEKKATYINQLLKVGFDTIDFGSFVSPKAIPQLKDTAKVLSMLELENTASKLLAIIANTRGANDAVQFEEITYLGYPFSISETFQQRNTNASIDQSLKRVEEIQEISQKNGKSLLIYISMAFGNPYGDPWSGELAAGWVERLSKELEIKHFAMADTVGVSDVKNISEMFSTLLPEFPHLEIGAHLHTRPDEAQTKAAAAYESGCRKFDAAILGFGGCPMAEDDLVGNMDTEKLIKTLEKNTEIGLDRNALEASILLASQTFPV